jgi:colanic acid/amylovoran biosynthesis glycosyltransferase
LGNALQQRSLGNDSPHGMRIGYFTGIYPRATDTFIQREIHGLRARGFDVRTFSIRKSGPDHDVSAQIREEKRNTHYLLPANPVLLLAANVARLITAPRRYLAALNLAWRCARPGWRGLLYQMFYFQEAVMLAGELRRQQIGHLHNHLGDAAGTVTLLACQMARVGFSITIHGPHIFFDPTHWALREKVRYSRFVVCISHYCRSQMMLFTDQRDWSRLVIVHCGVDPSRYVFCLPREGARKLLYTGRLAAEKGLPVLFESLSQLRAQGYAFELTLVGDGPDRGALEHLARSVGIAGDVKFTGFLGQEEVLGHLRQSDMLLLPSFAEGVPVSLMEAMACGVPVVATFVGGVVELVEHGVTGQVVHAGDPQSLGNAIARYLDDPELRQRVSRQGREKVAAAFNMDTEIDKLAALFLSHAGGVRP